MLGPSAGTTNLFTRLSDYKETPQNRELDRTNSPVLTGLLKKEFFFELMSEKLSGDDIKYKVIEMCKEWNLLDKILGCSTDNATANIKCMELLCDETNV